MMAEIDKVRKRGTENGKGLSSKLRHRAQGWTHRRIVEALGNSEGGVELRNKLRNERRATMLRANGIVLVSVLDEGQGLRCTVDVVTCAEEGLG
ncbi:hypothetical protein CDL15_Pgr003978 [Punica granatum]|uniref:Uncharacterized protein n=1 Tax=Punica granatum TaxID=22663 RepID=A0A218WNW7_PUNGR|nr:hypothetical protein CDL15_Pgr003978 [Punica granatum]